MRIEMIGKKDSEINLWKEKQEEEGNTKKLKRNNSKTKSSSASLKCRNSDNSLRNGIDFLEILRYYSITH